MRQSIFVSDNFNYRLANFLRCIFSFTPYRKYFSTLLHASCTSAPGSNDKILVSMISKHKIFFKFLRSVFYKRVPPPSILFFILEHGVSCYDLRLCECWAVKNKQIVWRFIHTRSLFSISAGSWRLFMEWMLTCRIKTTGESSEAKPRYWCLAFLEVKF